MNEEILKFAKKAEDAGLDPTRETLELLDRINSGRISKNVFENLRKKGVTPEDYISKRKKGTPHEYILGESVFMGRRFKCNSSTLIPTPETEILVREAVKVIKSRTTSKDKQVVIDLGTGSGNIAISIALETDGIEMYASDICGNALKVARENVVFHSVGHKIELRNGDIFTPFSLDEFQNEVDLIVCNPPYLPTESINRLPPEIRDFEPLKALDAGPFGIEFYVRLFDNAHNYLKDDGILILEIGEGQEKIVKRVAKKSKGDYHIENIMYGDQIRFLKVSPEN